MGKQDKPTRDSVFMRGGESAHQRAVDDEDVEGHAKTFGASSAKTMGASSAKTFGASSAKQRAAPGDEDV